MKLRPHLSAILLGLTGLSTATLDPNNPGKIICYSYTGRELSNNTRCPGSDTCCNAADTCLPERLCLQASLDMVVPPCAVWPWTDDCSQICKYVSTDLGTGFLPRAVNCTDGSLCCDNNPTCCDYQQGVFLNSNGIIASYDVSYSAATSTSVSQTPVLTSATSSSSSSSSASTTSVASTSTQPSSPASSPSSSSSTTSSGLTTGAKAGIGIGVALGVLALIAIASLVILRRRKRNTVQQQQQQQKHLSPGQHPSIPEMDALVHSPYTQHRPGQPVEKMGEEIYQKDGSEPAATRTTTNANADPSKNQELSPFWSFFQDHYPRKKHENE